MKNQALFSSKDKSKNLKSRLLQFLFGAFRVKGSPISHHVFIPLIHPPVYKTLLYFSIVRLNV